MIKSTDFEGTVFEVVNLAEILNSPFGRDGTSMNVTPGLRRKTECEVPYYNYNIKTFVTKYMYRYIHVLKR